MLTLYLIFLIPIFLVFLIKFMNMETEQNKSGSKSDNKAMRHRITVADDTPTPKQPAKPVTGVEITTKPVEPDTRVETAYIPEHQVTLQDAKHIATINEDYLILQAEHEGNRIVNRRYMDATMQTIIIPEGVVRICERAFFGCKNLESIQLPSTLEYIDEFAFCNCTALKSITFPDRLKVISDCAFKGCDSLESLILPDSVTDIGLSTFVGCQRLTSVHLPKGIQTLPAFSGCPLSNFEIPTGITVIPDGCFRGANFKTIDIPDSVQDIGAEAFCFNANLEHIKLPEGIKKVKYGTFSWFCLKRISLPQSLERIEAESFYLTHLEELVIPDNVVYIGVRAFMGCLNLRSLTLGASMRLISREAFKGCEYLESVTCLNPVPPKCDETAWHWAMIKSERHLYVPKGSEDDYAKDPVWGYKFAERITGIEI